MKKIKIWLILAASVALLCACGQSEDIQSPIIVDEEPIATQSSETDETLSGTDSTQTVTEDDTLPPREGMVRSRLTNEWVDEEVANTRPIAVITPNESNAIPHYNLSKASILYEANVEGRMTRMMAIYEDWQDLEKIGNVRSLRTYYAYWAFEWDAFIVHFGGPFFIDELLAQVEPRDLTRFGLIPEFIGRVPVMVSLKQLTKEAMIRILSEPKNALTKQYQKLFELDNVKLEFTKEALEEIAQLAVDRRIGARGLRSIMESAIMDLMYEIPSDDSIGICTITKDVVDKTGKPELVYRDVPPAPAHKALGNRLRAGSKSGEIA